MKTHSILIGLCAGLLLPLVAFGQGHGHGHGADGHDEAKAKTGELRVYLADSSKAPASLDGMTAMVIVEPEGGKRRVLRLKLVSPKGTKKTGLGHDGEVRKAGPYYVELVVKEAEADHGGGHGEHGHDGGDATPYFAAKLALSGYTCGMKGHPVLSKAGKCPKCSMKLKVTDLKFSAVVVLRKKGKTINAKGFKHPSQAPKDFADGLAQIAKHIKTIQGLIDSNQLLKVHPAASKISQISKLLPPMAPKGKEGAVEATCKAIRALFSEIDEAGDNKRKKEAQAALDKYSAKLKELKAYAR
ncbi:MAG: hypothetical protein JKY65_10095 [Planctomycetes bacterium]|nr:hypothetical protein [Planctomycetota bacterium]